MPQPLIIIDDRIMMMVGNTNRKWILLHRPPMEFAFVPDSEYLAHELRARTVQQ
jgi:hypothetical protein